MDTNMQENNKSTAVSQQFTRQAGLGIQILQNCRNELYSFFPYLDGAFASLIYRADPEAGSIGTEGEYLSFSPDFLMRRYLSDSAMVRRGYLHILLHCLYLHLFRERQYERVKWNLACDMAVEQIIEREELSNLRLPSHRIREKCFQILGNKSFSAEQIYGMLEHGRFPFTEEEMAEAFAFDSHSLWNEQSDPVKIARTKRKWEKILAYTGQNKQEQKRRAGRKRGFREEEAEIVHKSKYDYRKFLKQFAIPREEVELDTESFDYIFYHYGMEHYKNMPLIEPLEYKEVNRLEELVIAIDTSGSCSKETVQQFLAETYGILSEKENFFRKMKVYLLQCDCYVQEVAVIGSEEEWRNYSKDIKIQGRGGTDFRPVFRFVKEQQEKKEIRNLKALIYFTDGDGIYPRCKPEYETAFVFLRETAKMDMVPAWALRLFAG